MDFEDDYDSEFRYGGRRFGPLWVLGQGDRALRLGYLVLPEGLVDSFEAAHVSSDIHRPHLEQVAMAAFMDDGHFARHPRRSADLHAERRQELLDGVAANLAGLLVAQPAESGLHMLTRLPPHYDDVRFCAEAVKRGTKPWPLSIHHLGDAAPGMLLGFGCSGPAAIREGMRTLASVLSVGGWGVSSRCLLDCWSEKGMQQGRTGRLFASGLCTPLGPTNGVGCMVRA